MKISAGRRRTAASPDKPHHAPQPQPQIPGPDSDAIGGDELRARAYVKAALGETDVLALPWWSTHSAEQDIHPSPPAYHVEVHHHHYAPPPAVQPPGRERTFDFSWITADKPRLVAVAAGVMIQPVWYALARDAGLGAPIGMAFMASLVTGYWLLAAGLPRPHHPLAVHAQHLGCGVLSAHLRPHRHCPDRSPLMFSRAAYITVGGLTIALAIVVWRTVRWWRHDTKNWKALLPFLLGQAPGMLSVLCTGGALGYFFGFVAHLMNMGGDKVLSGTTGAKSSAIHGGSHPGVITEYGAMVLLLLCVGLAAAWKSITKKVSFEFGLGAVSGSGLGLPAGGAGLAADTLVPFVNWLGALIAGAFN